PPPTQPNPQHHKHPPNPPPPPKKPHHPGEAYKRAERSKVDDAAVSGADHGGCKNLTGAQSASKVGLKDARPDGFIGLKCWRPGGDSGRIHQHVDPAEVFKDPIVQSLD